MKIPPAPKAKKNNGPKHGVLFTDVRREFETLEPVNLRSLGVVAPKAHRPQFSAFCKQKGLEYASLSINEDEAVYFIVE